MAFGHACNSWWLALAFWSLWFTLGLGLRWVYVFITGHELALDESLWVPLAWGVFGGAAVFLSYILVFFGVVWVLRMRKRVVVFVGPIVARRTCRKLLQLRVKRTLRLSLREWLQRAGGLSERKS
jgi:hypothetical protein